MRRPEPNPQQTGHDGPSAPAATACASPPCLFGTCEADATKAQERASSPEAAASAWQEVRLWRKAKRQVMIDRRLAIPAAERAMHAEAVTQCLSDLLKSFDGAVVGFYWPFKGEYDPRPLARALHERGVALALPVVVAKARPMIFRPWYPKVPMTLGIWNIPVPAAGPTVVPDVLLVPVVGFDKRGYRLGYGGGYYDRTLAAQTMRPHTLAIGFAISEIPTIHPQPHDIPMDLVVTELGIRVMRTAPAAE